MPRAMHHAVHRATHRATHRAMQARWASSREVPTICRASGSFSPHLTLGAVGCALAHRAAWERLAASTSHDWALIAEDDLHAVAQPFASRRQRYTPDLRSLLLTQPYSLSLALSRLPFSLPLSA